MTPTHRPAYLQDPFGTSTAVDDQGRLAPSTGMVDLADAGAMFLVPSAEAAHHHTTNGPVVGSSDDTRATGRRARNRWQR